MSSYPTISPQFDSDEKGQQILKEILGGNFLLRDYKPDFFLDYHAERRVNGEPAGQPVFIQLKSQASLHEIDNFGKVQFERKHLRYYDETVEEPVFIVLVDVARKRAFYLFAQQWIEAERSRLGLTQEGRVTVSVPVRNDLSNVPQFIADCEAARRLMKEKYPGSPEAALAKYALGFSQLDPRFKVRAFLTPKGRQLNISAKEPVKVNFKFSHPQTGDVARQFSDAHQYGRSLKIKDLRVEVEGSPLFQKLFENEVRLFKWESKGMECNLVLTTPDSTVGLDLILPARLTRGTRGFLMTTVADDCPLIIEDTFSIDDLGIQSAAGSLNITVSLAAWEGRPIQTLLWFDGVTSFLAAIAAHARMVFKLVDKGRKLMGGSFSAPDSKEHYEQIAAGVDLIRRARALCVAGGINPPVPNIEEVTEREFTDIVFSHELLQGGVLTVDTLNLVLPPESDFQRVAGEAFKERGECIWPGRLESVHKIRFFGTECYVGVMFVEEENLKFEAQQPPLGTTPKKDHLYVRVSSPDGPMRLRLVKPPPP